MTHDPIPDAPELLSTHGPTLSTVEAAKRKAAYQAVDTHFPAKPRAVGIGSGSTVVYVVERIVQLGRARLEGIIFVPTGYQSRELLVQGGLRVGSVDEHMELDVVFDGADEVDADLNCIKGGGACLFQEKLVAILGKKFVCVADFRKISTSLSTQFKAGVPIEVVPPAAPYVLKRLVALGAQDPKLRMGGSAKAGPCITDNSNFIIDAPFPDGFVRPGAAADAHSSERVVGGGIGGNRAVGELARILKNIVGVVEHGLFWAGDKKPVMAYFGMEDGGVTIQGS